MALGYSKILIRDCIAKNEQIEWQHLALYLFIMALESSQECGECAWHELIESCGLRIAGIYSNGNGSLIEV